MTRRSLLRSLSLLASTLPFTSWAVPLLQAANKPFHFVLLGDLHFDKLSEHDVGYVQQEYPGNLSQIENYSRITRDNLSYLMDASKELARKIDARFYLQIGDFVEGLCGSKALASAQTTDFIRYIDQQHLNSPFLVIKGNHDISGAGAKEVYEETVLPWQSKQLQQTVSSANNVYVYNHARFILFDCFSEKESLAWLKEVLKSHQPHETLFFCTHLPVVPFDARSNWIIYAHPAQQPEREELMNLLAEHKAIVLSGHLHKTSILVRNTSSGNFVQVGIGSVIPTLNSPVKNHLKGLDAYGEDLVNLEPHFSPASLADRRDILKKEKPGIRYYEYADFCGYAGIDVGKDKDVTLSIFANADKQCWLKINLTRLFNA
jgi:3',5'-cyclic AMP phosphodiesterase CpdA